MIPDAIVFGLPEYSENIKPAEPNEFDKKLILFNDGKYTKIGYLVSDGKGGFKYDGIDSQRGIYYYLYISNGGPKEVVHLGKTINQISKRVASANAAKDEYVKKGSTTACKAKTRKEIVLLFDSGILEVWWADIPNVITNDIQWGSQTIKLTPDIDYCEELAHTSFINIFGKLPRFTIQRAGGSKE